ncbi:MAG: choice-of-anchor D domain-containing protein [Ignavibacteriaceae bacterium]|nr:choice-of-anchor D domain-containing protein [Ignavibacteriaceae bacterium]
MKKLIILLTILILFNTSNVFGQTTRNVPSQYATIQAGLNAAQSGDTVLVQPGTYYENIIWPDVNRIKLISAGDNSNTIIDAKKIANVINIVSNGLIDTNTVVKGFNLINGDNVNNWGGILCNNANPKFENIEVNSNKANLNGGGIYMINCSPLFINCNIHDNLVTGEGVYYGGGGIYANNSNAIFFNTTVSNNNGFFGGGVLLYQSNVDIQNCLIYKNTTRYQGGGLYLVRSSPHIVGTLIINNNGAGVYCYDRSKPTIENVKIIGNTQIGADCTSGSIPVFIKTTISFNGSSGIVGGDLMTLNNITISNNRELTNLRPALTGLINIINSNIVFNGIAYNNTNNAFILQATNNWWGTNSGPYHSTQNPNGKGDSVNVFVNVTPWLTSPDTTAPPIPIQKVKITNTNSNSVALNWEPSPLGDLKGYKVYWDTDSLGYAYQNSIDVGGDTSYTITGLTPGYNYHFAVTCYDNSGDESWFSKDVAAKTTPPVLQLLTNQINFSNTAIGDSTILQVKILSANSSPLIISSLTNSLTVFKTALTLPTTVNGYDTLKFNVTFKPSAFGSYTDTLSIISNGGNAKVILQGQSPVPTLALNVSNINFGTVVRNTSADKIIKAANSAVNKLVIDSMYVHTSAFSVSSTSGIISNNDSLIITVRFSPSEFGVFKDTLEILNNSDNHLVRIPLEGNTPIQIVLTGGNINFGNVPLSDTLSQDLFLSNVFNGPLIIDSIYVRDAQFSVSPNNAIVNPLDTLKLKVLFIPNNFGAVQDTLSFFNVSQGIFLKVSLNGTSPYPVFSASTDYIKFDSTLLNTTVTKKFYVKNSSINTLTLDSLYFGENKFSISSISTQLIRRGDSSHVTVSFNPQTIGFISDTLYIVNNSISRINKIVISGIGENLTGIENANSSLPKEYLLYQNHPNPFNPSTVIKYALPFDSKVLIKIYNVLGQDVKLLKDEIISAGSYEVQFNSSSLSSGVYFYRLSAVSLDGKQKYSSIKKMILLK